MNVSLAKQIEYTEKMKLAKPYAGKLSGTEVRHELKLKYGLNVSPAKWQRALKYTRTVWPRHRSPGVKKSKVKVELYGISELALTMTHSKWDNTLCLQ